MALSWFACSVHHLVIASLTLTLWKMFPIGFRSGLRAGMVNFFAPTAEIACCAFRLFWLGSPSCKKSLPFLLLLFSKSVGNCSRSKSANFWPFKWPTYCSARITPLLYAIAKIKCAVRPPLPSCEPLDVWLKLRPSEGFRRFYLDGGSANEGMQQFVRVFRWPHLPKLYVLCKNSYGLF